jgi:hypothetical protein
MMMPTSRCIEISAHLAAGLMNADPAHPFSHFFGVHEVWQLVWQRITMTAKKEPPETLEASCRLMPFARAAICSVGEEIADGPLENTILRGRDCHARRIHA